MVSYFLLDELSNLGYIAELTYFVWVRDHILILKDLLRYVYFFETKTPDSIALNTSPATHLFSMSVNQVEPVLGIFNRITDLRYDKYIGILMIQSQPKWLADIARWSAKCISTICYEWCGASDEGGPRNHVDHADHYQ
jgi:hypothetical protein